MTGNLVKVWHEAGRTGIIDALVGLHGAFVTHGLATASDRRFLVAMLDV